MARLAVTALRDETEWTGPKAEMVPTALRGAMDHLAAMAWMVLRAGTALMEPPGMTAPRAVTVWMACRGGTA